MTFKDSYDLLNFIKVYNSTIIDAVDHGGDSGGPYFCNEDGLKESIGMIIAQIEANNKELIEKYPLTMAYDVTGHIPLIVVLVK